MLQAVVLVVAAASAEPALGANTAAALADVRKRFGAGAQLLSVDVSPGETAIAVQDRDKSGNVDLHRYEAGAAPASEPVPVGYAEFALDGTRKRVMRW